MKLGIDFAGFPCLCEGNPTLFAAVAATSRRVNAAMALPFPDILPVLSPVLAKRRLSTLSPRAEMTTALDRKRRKASVRHILGESLRVLGERSPQKGA
jgi:hypothetical protein